MDYNIDATNQILGRLASKVALLLRGKDSPAFDPTRLGANKVTVSNAAKLRFSGRKLNQKFYRRHSGFHGGLKQLKLKEMITKDPRLSLRLAVEGMLPKNRSRSKVMKNLEILK